MAQAKDQQKYAPGVTCGVEYYKSGKLTFDSAELDALKALIQKLNTRDMASRREQVILVWKKRLYHRNLQHILPIRGGGWQIPEVGSGYNPKDMDGQAMFTCNIYTPYGDILCAALTRDTPKTRFEPSDPDDDISITASESAEKLKTRIERDNQMLAKMEDMARFLYVDGEAIFFSTYEKDGQRFGYVSNEPGAVPEDEEKLSEEEETEHAAEENSEPVGEGGEENSEGMEGEPEETGEPCGHEVLRVEGALEWKLPIKAQCLADCSYARRSVEIDLQIARAKYPDVADQIHPAQGGPGGDDIDRLARINVNLGVMDSYNTMDSSMFDVTEQKTFLRPAALMDVPEGPTRDSLIEKCFVTENGQRVAKGLYLTYCGETFCEGYAASMDDHVKLLHGRSGDGSNRPALGDWLVPVQEVLNTWLELAHDYFVRGVPAKWMDNEMFNVSAMKNQVNQVGDVHPFDREPGVAMEEAIWEETPPKFPEEMIAFIQDFKGDFAQLLTGAHPAMSGAGDVAAANETYGGMLVQRDQALERIGLPWRRVKETLSAVYADLVRMLARNHDEAINIVGTEAVRVEMEQLRGNFYAFPETDENFPESYTEITNRLTKLWADATTNPAIAELVYNPANLELFKRAFGVEQLYLPQVDARDKQLGEAVLLLKAGPVPNPELIAAKKELATLQPQIEQLTAEGNVEAAAGMNEQAQQLSAQMAKIPPMVSSVEIDPECDDNVTEAATCLEIINSRRGREMKNGTPEEQEGFANLRLHYLEHMQAAKAKQQGQTKPTKAPSVSLALKDMPARVAAEAANAAGLPATEQDFAQQQVATAVEKHPKDISV